MTRSVNRRQFIGQSVAAGALASAWHLGGSPARAADSPNEKLNLAAVGVAHKAAHNIAQLKSENFVALCDVDENFLNVAAKEFPNAKLFRDYRQMLDAVADQIDGVVVSTADHMHAPATSAALALKKHVYCEKPLTHTVAEARAISELAKESGVATQMGTQIHATDNYRRVVELIQSGAIIDYEGVVRRLAPPRRGRGRDARSDGQPPVRLGSEPPVPCSQRGRCTCRV